MFAYNKNYQDMQPPSEDLAISARKDAENISSQRFKVFTMNYLIRQTLDFGEDEGESRVRRIANWKLKTTENVLRSLLLHHMDKIAK